MPGSDSAPDTFYFYVEQPTEVVPGEGIPIVLHYTGPLDPDIPTKSYRVIIKTLTKDGLPISGSETVLAGKTAQPATSDRDSTLWFEYEDDQVSFTDAAAGKSWGLQYVLQVKLAKKPPQTVASIEADEILVTEE